MLFFNAFCILYHKVDLYCNKKHEREKVCSCYYCAPVGGAQELHTRQFNQRGSAHLTLLRKSWLAVVFGVLCLCGTVW